jgi:hypothetical protein
VRFGGPQRKPATGFVGVENGFARQMSVSTLDAELDDLGAQPAMLGGHAADRDG